MKSFCKLHNFNFHGHNLFAAFWFPPLVPLELPSIDLDHLTIKCFIPIVQCRQHGPWIRRHFHIYIFLYVYSLLPDMAAEVALFFSLPSTKMLEQRLPIHTKDTFRFISGTIKFSSYSPPSAKNVAYAFLLITDTHLWYHLTQRWLSLTIFISRTWGKMYYCVSTNLSASTCVDNNYAYKSLMSFEIMQT